MRRIWQDVRAHRNLDTYVATLIAIVFAALGVVGDIVPEGLKWAAVFAALGMLLFRIALPARPATPIERLLADRDAFDEDPFPGLVKKASQLWIFGPSAINILSPAHCETIRKSLLDKGSGDVRIVVLDPERTDSVALAVKQLDESLQFQAQDFRASLQASIAQLDRMAGWTNVGNFGYRFAPYNPGFSLVAIDPASRHGRIIVEFHGYRNEATGSRMHITLTRWDSEEWFRYWIHQFEQIWSNARAPASVSSPS